MKKVYISSPYRTVQKEAVPAAKELAHNLRLARKGCRMAIDRGFIPVAPHLLFPQFLNEESEREIGIELGMELLKECDEIWVLGSRISDGMADEISYARDLGIFVRVMENPMTTNERVIKAIKEGEACSMKNS